MVQWKQRYERLIELLEQGMAYSPEYAETLKPMTVAAWNSMFKDEQTEIEALGQRLYSRMINRNETQAKST